MSIDDIKENHWKEYFELVLENRHREAFQHLQELAELDPTDERLHTEIAALLTELGEVPLESPDDESSDISVDDIELLTFDSVPEIFATIPSEDIEELERSGSYRTFFAGDFVFKEGDIGDSMFIIKSGKALVTVSTSGEPLAVATLEDGNFFGEMALLSRRPRTASVTALGELMVVEIPREGLKALVGKHPDVPRKLADFFNRRAQDSNRKLQADSKSQADESAPEVEI
jgi:CRP-like cAMP-binding protein